MSNGIGIDMPADLAGESKFQRWTRVGFIARGLLYIIIGVLVIGTGRTEDLTGALEYLGDGLGRILLAVLALGMVTYGLWRFADAAFGIENYGSDGKAMRKRASSGLIGAIYLYLAYKAVRILTDGSAGGAGGTQQQADTVLDLPGGALVLGLAALVFAVAGAMQLYHAWDCAFMRKLNVSQPLIRWLGRLGYAARGVIFLAVAFLIGKAALDGRSDEAGGMEQALDLLSGPLLYAVAAGLMLFGLFSIIEARFRRIHDAPEDVKHEVERVTGA